MLKWIDIAIDNGCHVCKDCLDLWLGILVQAWGTQILQGSCAVPVNIRKDPCCLGNLPRVKVGTVYLVLGARNISAAIVALQISPNLVLDSHATTGFRRYIGARRYHQIGRVCAGKAGRGRRVTRLKGLAECDMGKQREYCDDAWCGRLEHDE